MSKYFLNIAVVLLFSFLSNVDFHAYACEKHDKKIKVESKHFDAVVAWNNKMPKVVNRSNSVKNSKSIIKGVFNCNALDGVFAISARLSQASSLPLEGDNSIGCSTEKRGELYLYSSEDYLPSSADLIVTVQSSTGELSEVKLPFKVTDVF